MRVAHIKHNYFAPAAFKGRVRGKGEAGATPHVKHTGDGVLLTDGPPPHQDVLIHRPIALFSKMVQMCLMGKIENGQMLVCCVI